MQDRDSGRSDHAAGRNWKSAYAFYRTLDFPTFDTVFADCMSQ